MMKEPFELIYRHPDAALRQGDVIELSGLKATMLSIGETGPNRVAFEMDRPLDHDSILLYAWHDGRLIRFRPLPVGESALLRWQAP